MHTLIGISIHSLREEGDTISVTVWDIVKQFQSTPSVRRETPVEVYIEWHEKTFQSTPSVRRETVQSLTSRQ